jgi:hypothetical protein
MGLAVNSLLHAAKWCILHGARHSPLHRRWQVGMLLKRRNRKWDSRLAKELVAKYGVIDA